MRKFLISTAVAASALAVATPAAAQWYPQQQQQQQQRYGAPYGNAYGYNNNYGQVRQMHMQIDTIQRRINQLDQLNTLSNREAQMLRSESISIERRLRSFGANGLNVYERNEIQQRIGQLSQHLRAEANSGRRWSRNDYKRNVRYNRNRDR